MKKEKVYIIGSGPMPHWCRDLLMPFRKFGGKTGYEFHGTTRSYDLEIGDKLILRKGKINIWRRGKASK